MWRADVNGFCCFSGRVEGRKGRKCVWGSLKIWCISSNVFLKGNNWKPNHTKFLAKAIIYKTRAIKNQGQYNCKS